MKPSEYMKSRKFIDHDTYISDLDKRFIDKEELKEKIILKISELENILELIDKC
jgi:hypothetical protein